MISIKQQGTTINVAVYGEFTLADYQEFERNVLYTIQFQGVAHLLLDLRDMQRYTIDMAWEEIRFSRAHEHEFGRVAVVVNDQWTTWSAWVTRLFAKVDVQVFDQYEDAERWINEAASAK